MQQLQFSQKFANGRSATIPSKTVRPKRRPASSNSRRCSGLIADFSHGYLRAHEYMPHHSCSHVLGVPSEGNTSQERIYAFFYSI